MKDTLIVCSEAIFKKCSKCGEIKSISEFYRFFCKKTQESCMSYLCKNCKCINNLICSLKHKNKRQVYQKEYRKVNKNKRLKYLIENKEKIKKKREEWKSKNKLNIEIYKLKNKERDKQSAKRRRKLNKHKIRQYIQKRKQDKYFCFIMNIRSRIYHGVKNNKIPTKKSQKTRMLLCCDWKFAHLHLEKQFRDGMTWENYGKVWHIDHIIPISFFDLSDPTEQKLAFHWGNLQPLLIHENFLKSDKIPQKTNFKY